MVLGLIGIENPQSNILLRDNFTVQKVAVMSGCHRICATYNGLCFGVAVDAIKVWQSSFIELGS